VPIGVELIFFNYFNYIYLLMTTPPNHFMFIFK
jgi:hypothetical protein